MKISNIDFIDLPLVHDNINHPGGVTGGTNGTYTTFSINIGGIAIAVGDLSARTLLRGSVQVFTLSSFGY